ncbi:MAG: hypothetical protein FWC92_05960 [Defluviitaleaceae bacterium]|nr:hypothetical protein [Defluviitaleaceae bacterium]
MKIIINGIEVFVEESESYIQINDINQKDLAGIWEPLTTRYPGYEVTLCFRDMPPPTEALAAIGAEVLEDCIAMKVTQHEYKPCDSHEIKPLTKADYAGFAELHDKLNPPPDMYWTSQRILQKWDIWRIFVVYENGNITGYALIRLDMGDSALGEIFGVESDNPAHRVALFSAVVECAFENGKSTVLRMVDRDNSRGEYEAALAVGFRETGYYIGYIVRN